MRDPNWLDEFNEALGEAASGTDQLFILGRKLCDVGMGGVGEQIIDWAVLIRESLAKADLAIGNKIDTDFREAQRNTWGTLSEIARMASGGSNEP